MKPGGRWLDTATGGFFSVAIHVVVLLGTSLIFLEQLIGIDSDASIGCGLRKDCEGYSVIESPRDFFERKPPASDPVEEMLSSELRPSRSELEADEPTCRWGLFPGKGSVYTCPSNYVGGNGPAATRPSLPSDRSARETRLGPPLVRQWACYLRSCGGAVTYCLNWLARHQNPDGSWGADRFRGQCVRQGCTGDGDPAFDEGVTSLALLAFLGAGYTPLSRDTVTDPVEPGRALHFGETVKKGLQWLISRQDAQGGIGRVGPKFMYNHALATLALSEAYGMTLTPALHAPAQSAVDFLIAAQNPGAGWRYDVRPGENDTSVTGWAVMALKSAELSELTVPKAAVDGALAWLDKASVTGANPSVGYTFAGSGKVYLPGRSEDYAHHPTMSAVAAASRILLRDDRTQGPLAATIVADLPSTASGQIDYIYWYYGTLALHQQDGPRGRYWSQWNDPMKKAIVGLQKKEKDGCENGSWDPTIDRWGSEGGRVYATAMNALTLEAYYRYANVFGGQSRK